MPVGARTKRILRVYRSQVEGDGKADSFGIPRIEPFLLIRQDIRHGAILPYGHSHRKQKAVNLMSSRRPSEGQECYTGQPIFWGQLSGHSTPLPIPSLAVPRTPCPPTHPS